MIDVLERVPWLSVVLIYSGSQQRVSSVMAKLCVQADRDGDGEVNEEEFFRIMKKTSLF